MFVQIPRERSVKMSNRVLAFGDRMAAIGIGTAVNSLLCAINSFISRSCLGNDSCRRQYRESVEVPFELAGMSDRRTKSVVLGVVCWQPHVSLLIDGVVKQLTGVGCNRNRG